MSALPASWVAIRACQCCLEASPTSTTRCASTPWAQTPTWILRRSSSIGFPGRRSSLPQATCDHSGRGKPRDFRGHRIRSMHMKIGFIGLGRMGAPMVRNIARSGAELIVWDVSPNAVQALVADGAHAGESAAHVTSKVHILFTSLPGPVASEAVVFGPAGILESVRPGQVYFDLSTNSLALIRRIHNAFAERGAAVLDAPVSGGPAGADTGKLAIWVGGDQAVFERQLPLLRTFSDSPRRIGEIGAGTVAKLVHNLSCYAMCSVLAETFSLGVKAGVDPMDLYEALYTGVMGRGSILELLHPKFLS